MRGPPGAGWSSLAARRAHNPKVAGSNPAPATNNNTCHPGGSLKSRLDEAGLRVDQHFVRLCDHSDRADEPFQLLRHFYQDLGDRIGGPFGFVDGFSEQHEWYADTFLAINQGPIIVMIENHPSGLLWKLFMGIPEIQAGLKRLGFRSPHFP
jgi:hypothetical protein